jgi:TPR repeat protein
MVAVSVCYDTGVAREVLAAAQWYRRSAELRSVMGMLALGMCYRGREGI